MPRFTTRYVAAADVLLRRLFFSCRLIDAAAFISSLAATPLLPAAALPPLLRHAYAAIAVIA